MNNKLYMSIAALEAAKAVKNEVGGPFGAVIVLDDKIIATGHNTVVGTNDPSNHAEVNTIRIAIKEFKKNNKDIDLSNAIIYSSCEPCPMCLATICRAGIKDVFIGCTREDAKKSGFDDSFIYDVFSGKSNKNQIKMDIRKDIKDISDLVELLKGKYKLRLNEDNQDCTSFILKVKRDDENHVISSKIIASAKDNFEQTQDPTSYASINVIRDASKIKNNFDLSEYELVSLNQPLAISFATMHWAKLIDVTCGINYEKEYGVDENRVLATINGDKDKSLIKTQSIGREDCIKAFELWENKINRVKY